MSPKGRERVMSPASEPRAEITDMKAVDVQSGELEAADLESIVTTIAKSPIVVAPVEPKFVLSDWERVRRSPDADGFILAWIASHVRPRHPKTLS